MKKRNFIKFGIDLAMVLVFALLFNKMVLGMAFHEIAGLAVGGVIIVHLILNRNWI